MTRLLRGGLPAAIAALTLSACTIQTQGLAPTRRLTFTTPTVGLYRCLASDPGVPIYDHGAGTLVIGYTRDVVADYGQYGGNMISIVNYYGGLGRVDVAHVR